MKNSGPLRRFDSEGEYNVGNIVTPARSIYLSTKPGQTCSAESRELDPDKVNM